MTALTWAPPNGWESYTPVDLTTGTQTLNLTNGVDYLLRAPKAPITGPKTIVGGRNLVMRGCFVGGRTSQPSLTSSYDSTNRGFRIDPSAGSANRIIFFEGIKSLSGTYLSDLIQFYNANAPVSGISFYLQNVLAEAWNWGNNVTSPNVHADLVQFYSGPTNFFMDRVDAFKQTYQGLYLDARNYAAAGVNPGGTKVPWEIRNVQLVRESAGGTGQPAGISCALNKAETWAGPDMIQDNVWVRGFKSISTFGGWPADPEFHENATPPARMTDPANWDDATYTYTSPGYASSGPDSTVLASGAQMALPNTYSQLVNGGGLVAASPAALALAAGSPLVAGGGFVDVQALAAAIQMNQTSHVIFGGNQYAPGTLISRVKAGV